MGDVLPPARSRPAGRPISPSPYGTYVIITAIMNILITLMLLLLLLLLLLIIIIINIIIIIIIIIIVSWERGQGGARPIFVLY